MVQKLHGASYIKNEQSYYFRGPDRQSATNAEPAAPLKTTRASIQTAKTAPEPHETQQCQHPLSLILPVTETATSAAKKDHSALNELKNHDAHHWMKGAKTQDTEVRQVVITAI